LARGAAADIDSPKTARLEKRLENAKQNRSSAKTPEEAKRFDETAFTR
jgi:hypothetical protein